MITNIKVEKIVVSNGILDAKTYVPIDITSRVETPIIDTAQLDNVLDTTVLSYLSTISEPLKPLSRIKITITDTKNETTNTEYIYRLVENDLVENVVQGAKPIYRHTLSLIEITKQLERVTVDNILFTNYLANNYGTDSEIKYNIPDSFILSGLAAFNNWFCNAQLQPITYTNGNRFVGPYRIIYLSGYEKVEQGTNGALLVVANDTPTTDEDLEEGETIFDPNTQIKLEDVTPTQQNINIGDYVKYIDHTADNTISTNISLDIRVKHASTHLTAWFGWWRTDKVGLKEYWVEKPNGTTQNLTLDGSFTFTDSGTYIFKQRYKLIDRESSNGLTNGVELASFLITWSITTVNNLSFIPQEYTIKDVVDRLLRICQLKRKNIETPSFVLDDSITNKLNKKLSPEFNFTQGTLFEALQTIGEYIHAIPRIIPSVYYENEYDEQGNIVNSTRNDYTNWNVITFDFLGGTEKYNNNSYSIESLEHSLDEHANNFISYVENATHSNYSNTATVVEPFIGGFVSTRTESATFEISNNDCIFRTQKPIRSLISVKVFCKGKTKDIITNTIEKSRYDALYAHTAPGDIYNNKAFYLYYTKGQPNIFALSYLRPNQDFGDTWINKQAIKNILDIDASIDVEEYIKDLAVQIEYIPFQNFKVKQYRVDFDTTEENCTLFYNQQSNAVDVESFGESVKGAIMKTGNAKVIRTQYFDHLADAPHVGVITQDDYYAFVVNRTIGCNIPIKTTTQWSFRFNQLNAFTGVKSTKRESEISNEESYNRNADYQEFCLIDNDLDVDTYINDTEQSALQSFIMNKLSTIGFGSNLVMQQFANKLSNNNQTEYKPISYAIIKTVGTDRSGKEERHCCLLPVSCFPFGNSIVLHFAMTDNYSAATYSDVGEKDSYNIEHYVKYSNEFGRFKYLAVGYGSDNPLLNFNNNIKANSKKLYLVNENEINNNSIMVNYFENPFDYDKDSREQCALTLQLNFITNPKKSTILGKSQIFTMPLVGDKTTTYKTVVFTEKPNKFEENLPQSIYTIIGNPVATVDANYKFIKIAPFSSCKKAVGYGIIDSNGKLCVYFDQELENGTQTKPIYYMFRKY